MNYLIKGLLFVLSICQLMACANDEKVRLVVFISVDQMRGDFLPLFNEQLEHGFKTLQSGQSFTNVHHYHSNTVTAAGHATLLTGMLPSSHGIVGNTIYDRKSGKHIYSIVDTTVKFIGIDTCTLAKVSSRNLMSNTLGDLLKSQNPNSKSYSVAIKDRAAILMGGHQCNRAFWFDGHSTQMVSTDYYSEEFPTWVTDFKASTVMRKDLDAGWILEDNFKPIAGFTSKDSISQEADKFYPDFPHNASRFIPNMVNSYVDGTLIWNTPLGDKFVLNFAEELIEQQQLGTDDDLDFLTIGLSTADVIGHHFGPNSFEILDYYNKLDKYLETFISTLNSKIGKDNYIIVLSSDHGVCPIPEVTNEEGKNMRIGHGKFDSDIAIVADAVQTQFGLSKSIIKEADYSGFEPDLTALNENGVDTFTFIQYLTEQLREIPYVKEAFSRYDLADSACKKPFIQYVRHSTVPEQGYLIQFVPQPGYLIDFRDNGTTHGTPYRYDTHVPLLLYGKEIGHKEDSSLHYTIDIVPTLVELLGIETQEDFDGNSLY